MMLYRKLAENGIIAIDLHLDNVYFLRSGR